MLRITGGKIRGRLFKTPKTGTVRPTQDAVRAALFSMLADRVCGSVFVDLFGGSGGGPLNSATTPVLEMYKLGFQNFDLGSAAALGWMLAILIIGVSIVQFMLARRREWFE